jgi:hypothetical protein
MSRISLVLAAFLVAVVGLAATTAASIKAPASPSAPPASPSAQPVTPSAPTATPSASPTVTPAPSLTPPPATPAPSKAPVIATPRPPTPRPTSPAFTAAQQDLLDGIQRGTKDCQPARGSAELPKGAIAGIECDSTDPAVARVGFYMFANDDDMIDAYLTRMRAEGVELDSGSCNDGEAEGAYLPYEGFALDRAGCFVNDDGFANYRYTSTGKHVYIGILGKSADMLALETFAWKGSLDTPGIPTLWNGGID